MSRCRKRSVVRSGRLCVGAMLHLRAQLATRAALVLPCKVLCRGHIVCIEGRCAARSRCASELVTPAARRRVLLCCGCRAAGTAVGLLFRVGLWW